MEWFVPALFAIAALSTGARFATAVSHALAHPAARAWLDAGCDLLRTGISLAFALFTIGRAAPRQPARNPLAFIACAIAMGTAVASRDPSPATPDVLVVVGELVAVTGFAWMLLAVSVLGRCFGVLPEARGLVTRGPYGVVRHPVYLGEIGACLGLVVAAPAPINAVGFACFVAAQAVRMNLEERALQAAFPEYESYARRVPRLIPRPRRPASVLAPAPGEVGAEMTGAV
jgi:protein-S-isoprenylcysteine O-methyltransferase Ste14